MDFINKIGQRNCAKILTVIAFCFCFINNVVNGMGFLQGMIALSMFVIPNFILSLTSNNNKDFRLLSLITSFVLLSLNLVLLIVNLKLALFLLLIVQIIGTIIFYFYVNYFEKKKQLAYKNRRKKLKIGNVTKELDQNTIIQENS